MSGIKETSEVLKLATESALLFLKVNRDGVVTTAEKIRSLTLIPEAVDAFIGFSKVSSELKDIDPKEKEALLEQVLDSMEKSGKFTFRERDIARRVLALVYTIVVELAEISKLPLTAEPV